MRPNIPATDNQIICSVIILLCACASAALASSSNNKNQEDLKELVSLLGKLKDIERVRQTHAVAAASSARNSLASFGLPLEAYGPAPTGASVVKRQGAWSYDYGLGGGRFGKRNYGDYGIGGGRFGRDVDHVDPLDLH